MSVTPQDITNLAPEFAGESDSRIGIFLDLAGMFIPVGRWGTRYDTAIKLYTAHLLTLANRQGNGGSVLSEKVGDVERQYSASAQSDSQLGLTSWGQLFLQLRRGFVTTPLVV